MYVREKVECYRKDLDSEFFNSVSLDAQAVELPELGSEPSLEEYKSKRFDILRKIGFPHEYLWMTKCKTREEFQAKWRKRAGLNLPSDFPPKPYVLYLNSGERLLKVVGFRNQAEFQRACVKLADHAQKIIPPSLEEDIDDLAIDLPREWEHLPDRIQGESIFEGVAYLGDRIRQILFPEEILYIILKVQQRVKERGIIEAVQKFRSEDGVNIICSDTMRGKTDGWKMIVSPR